MPLLDQLRRRLLPAGLNLVGVADPAAWDALSTPARQASVLQPGTRAIIVVGNGGRALWEAMVPAMRRDPTLLTEQADPVDAWAGAAVRAADAVLGSAPRRWVFASATETTVVDFRVLAHLAGLGGHSRLGLLMHPDYGAWVGLRAACFVDLPLAPTGPLDLDLCAGCPAPCASACPGAAFPDGQWAVDACSAFQTRSTGCRAGCHARLACPVGAEHRYDAVQLHYHSDRASGRPRLRAQAGVPDAMDRFAGEGPHWTGWRERVDVRG